MKNIKRKILAYVALGYCIELIISLLLLIAILLYQNTMLLGNTITRVQEDIQYNGNRHMWDMSRYTADPQLPNTNSLYIISADGFILDRVRPIHGFFDTADFSHLLLYTHPQTVISPGNQKWRLYTMPILDRGDIIGAETVGYFDPLDVNMQAVDAKLQTALNILQKEIHVKNGTIHTEKIDQRNIDYDISYEIVNNYNKILGISYNTNSIDTIPTYIDRSYVGSLIQSHVNRMIVDDDTGEAYFVLQGYLYDQHHTVQGIIIAGHSIAYIITLILWYTGIEVGIGLGIFLWLLFSFNTFILRIKERINLYTAVPKAVHHISFSKKESVIIVDKERVNIPHDTNQYYLCELLFSNIQKKWESDEILEKFGIPFGSGSIRTVYDAMIAVNKKIVPILGEKLIVNKDKTYFINPSLLAYIVSA